MTNQNLQDFDNLKFRSDFIDGAAVVTGVFVTIGGTIIAMEGALVGAIGTLFGLGSANIWNPVGIILIVSGVVMSAFSLFFASSRRKKIAQAKMQAIYELQNAISKVKFDVIDKITNTINEILKQINIEHIDVLSEYLLYSIKYQSEIKELSTLIESISINSEKRKFQAMLSNILNSEYYLVQEVLHIDNRISIFLNELPNGLDHIQNILSRVEEKQILILKA